MQHHLFYRLLIISCTFFLISCQQTIECYLIPSTDKASDFHKVQPQNSGTLFLAKNEAEHIQIVFKGCPGETYKIHRNGNDDNSIRYSCRQIKSVYGFDDALVPIDGEQITLNDSIAKLWITFRTAESIRPGKYEEQISIDGNGKRQKIKNRSASVRHGITLDTFVTSSIRYHRKESHRLDFERTNFAKQTGMGRIMP